MAAKLEEGLSTRGQKIGNQKTVVRKKQSVLRLVKSVDLLTGQYLQPKKQKHL